MLGAQRASCAAGGREGGGRGKKEKREELGPVMDFVLMNASALLVVAGLAADYREGVRLARESIESGKAWEAFEKFRDAGLAQQK